MGPADMRTRLAWTLASLTCVCAMLQVTLLAVSARPLLSADNISDAFPLVTLASVAGAGLGALVVSRYPGHRIGWLLVVGAFGTALGLALQAYGRSALAGELGTGPGGHLAVWSSTQLGAVFAIAVLAALFLLAPDGHLLSDRWRWPLGLVVGGVLVSWAALLAVPPSSLDADGNSAARQGPLVQVVVLVGVVAVLVGLVAGAVSLLLRLRRATGEQRQQLRWMTGAAAGLAAGAIAAAAASLLSVPQWLAGLPLMVAYLAVQVCFGIAVLRLHLYDVDLIASRAIVLAMLTGLVGAGYVVVVLVIGGLVGAQAEGAFWPSLLATALVAIGVQPMRRRLVQLADRVVYGARAAPYEALSDFSKGLHESRTAGDLLPRIAEAVRRSAGARHAQIRVDLPGRPQAWHGSTDPEDRPPDLDLEVRDGPELLGGLSVTMPPGRGLRAPEERLLRDFALQLAGAFRSIRLEAELEDRVDELAVQASELSASTRRLLAAQAAGRRRFESAITREVLPHLADLPAELAALGAAAARGLAAPGATLARLGARVNTALESLRSLTRGVYPAQLLHGGLVPALTSHLDLAGHPRVLVADGAVAGHRFDPRVESAGYFCAVEFLRQLDTPESAALAISGDRLVLTVSGRGGSAAETATRHLADRVAPIGGTVRVDVAHGSATLRVHLPLDPEAGPVPEGLAAAEV